MNHVSQATSAETPSVCKWDFWVAISALIAGFGLRFFHLLTFHEAIDADEAITGLMGKHILIGQELPLFFYGQHYFGALEAYLVAVSYALLGISSQVLRFVPFVFSLALIGAGFLFCYVAFDRRTALLTSALLAVPSFYFFDFLQRALGGSESVLMMLLLATIGFHLLRKRKVPRWQVATFGVLCGFLFLVYQAVLLHIVVILAAILLLKPRLSRTSVMFWTLGFVFGALPLFIYNLCHPFATFLIIGVKYLGVSGSLYREHGLFVSASLSAFRRLGDLAAGLGNLLHLLTGSPLKDFGWPSLLLGTVYAFVTVCFFYLKRKRIVRFLKRQLKMEEIDGTDIVLLLLLLTFIAGFTRTRYLLFCYPLVTILTVRLLLSRSTTWLSHIALLTIMVYNGYGTVIHLQVQPKTPYKPIVEFLTENHLFFGYSGYYTAYPINFLSNERIVISPRAGPISVERYAPYSRQVEKANRTCFIFRADSPADDVFLSKLQELNARFTKASVASWHIYFDLDPKISKAIALPIHLQLQ